VQVTTLARVGKAAKSVDAPAIFVIGENVRLREGLDWLGALNDGRVLKADPLGRAKLRDVS
jgi:uroporphyrin-III C-methyltransferase